VEVRRIISGQWRKRWEERFPPADIRPICPITPYWERMMLLSPMIANGTRLKFLKNPD